MSTTLPDGITPKMAAEQMSEGLTATLSSADTSSTNSLQGLGLVYQARVSRLSRDAASAIAQYGETSTQAAAAQAAVSAAATTAARVAIINQQKSNDAPQISANGWALNGRVYSVDFKPLEGHSVFLVDDRKTYQQAYGFAYTDATGYFLIGFDGTANAAGAANAIGAAATSAPELFLQVVNTKADPVYLSTTPFEPVIGTATYQTIILSDGEPILGDPPADVRKVAMPSEQGTKSSTPTASVRQTQ
jgi:hypothetical protein